MKDDLGSKLGHRSFKLRVIPDIAANVIENGCNRRGSEKIGLGGGVKRISSNLRSPAGKPEREPAALESRVAGQEDPSPLPRIYHVFHGALPLAQSSSSLCLSRSVSIGCQKPLMKERLHLLLCGQALHRLSFKHRAFVGDLAR